MAYSSTSATWSKPGTYDTTRPYTKGAMYSPYLAGAEKWEALRMTQSSTSVTLRITWGYGFGTGSSSDSYTGSVVKGTISGGATGSYTIYPGYSASGNKYWRREEPPVSVTLVSGIAQTAYLPTKSSYSEITIANWTNGSKTFTMTISAGSQTTSHTVTLACPTYLPEVTISYNANGGSGTMSDTKYTIASTGTTNLRANTFTRPGYTFIGWHRNQTKANNGEIEYRDQNSWNLNNSGPTYLLYAVWKKNSYTLTANANSGKISATSGWTLSSSGDTATKTVEFDAYYSTLPVVSRIGYKVTNDTWLSASNEPVTITTRMGAGNTTIHVDWTEYTCTARFNPNGGSGTVTTQNFTYTGTQNLKTIAQLGFTRSKYTFKGWGLSPTATVPHFTNGESVRGENISPVDGAIVDLYAIWEVQRCTVQYYYIDSSRQQLAVRNESVPLTYTGRLWGVDQSVVPAYSSYVFSGYWELVNSTPSNIDACRKTDLVYDTYQTPYNKTKYSELTLVANQTYKLTAVYKRQLGTIERTTFTSANVIRYTPNGVNYATLKNALLTPGGLNNLTAYNNEQGQILFGALAFQAGYNYSQNVSNNLYDLTKSVINKTGLKPISSSLIQIPGLVINSSHVEVVISGTNVYLVFETSNTGGNPVVDPSVNYAISVNFGTTVTNDFKVAVSCSTRIVNQGLNYVLDVNTDGTMLSMGGVSVDNVSDIPNNPLRKYTPTPEARDSATIDAADDANRAVPQRLTALYNNVYIANSTSASSYHPGGTKYNKLIPALTEGRLEDEVVVTPDTLTNWNTRLNGQTPTPSQITVRSLEVTSNGTYTAPTGVAYTPVTVNVSGGMSARYFEGVLLITNQS